MLVEALVNEFAVEAFDVRDPSTIVVDDVARWLQPWMMKTRDGVRI